MLEDLEPTQVSISKALRQEDLGSVAKGGSYPGMEV